MKNINISLPESMDSYIEEQLKTYGYSNISEYLQYLINQDQQRKAKVNVENLLLEALDSGETTEMTSQDWSEIRQKVRKNHLVS